MRATQEITMCSAFGKERAQAFVFSGAPQKFVFGFCAVHCFIFFIYDMFKGTDDMSVSFTDDVELE